MKSTSWYINRWNNHDKEEKEACWGITYIWENADSDQESYNSSSSEEGEIWKLGSGELFSFNNNHSTKKLKQHKESCSNLDDSINANLFCQQSTELLYNILEMSMFVHNVHTSKLL